MNLLLATLFVANAECDTLKWKTTRTPYLRTDGSSFYMIDYLDSAVINIDTLSSFYTGVFAVNISNDTFYTNETYGIFSFTYIYADTGLIYGRWARKNYYFPAKYLPNDTMRIVFDEKTDLLYLMNRMKEVKGINIELEEISYWQMIIGIYNTSKDGDYSDSVYVVGADTSTFYVVRNPVSIKELQVTNYELRVYPNPTSNQLRISLPNPSERGAYAAEDANYSIYSVIGQMVMQGKLQEENTTINVANLANGMYFLKVGSKTVKFVKE